MSAPSAIDHEKKLLCAMMMKQGDVIPAVVEVLTADDFYRPEHRIIFNAIVSAYEKNKPLEPTFVIDELKSTGNLDRVGTKYFFGLLNQTATTAYANEHAKTIKEASVARQIVEFASVLISKAQDPAATVDELIGDVETFLVKTNAPEQSTFEPSTAMAMTVYERAKNLAQSPGLTGVATGLFDLNTLTNGLQRGELILLAARPSMGKTALALNIAQGAADAGKVVAVFSLEMSKLQIGIRLLSSISGVEASKISTGNNVTRRDFEWLLDAIERMEKHPVYVDDASGLSVAAMRMKLRRFKKELVLDGTDDKKRKERGLDLVVVDYLQLMRGNGENRVQEISSISRGLKALAKEFNVPVLALSQLSRNVEMRAEKKPQLSDLRDSGTLEQDADIVMFLYRDEYYNRDEADNKNVAELIVAKNRNGSTATIELFFRKETLQFGDFIRNLPPDMEESQ